MISAEEWTESCKKYGINIWWSPSNTFDTQEQFEECLAYLIDMFDDIGEEE